MRDMRNDKIDSLSAILRVLEQVDGYGEIASRRRQTNWLIEQLVEVAVLGDLDRYDAVVIVIVVFNIELEFATSRDITRRRRL
jgi:hypothetical protein